MIFWKRGVRSGGGSASSQSWTVEDDTHAVPEKGTNN